MDVKLNSINRDSSVDCFLVYLYIDRDISNVMRRSVSMILWSCSVGLIGEVL